MYYLDLGCRNRREVEAGIDAAEQTQEGYSTWSLHDYPYTTYEVDGLTYVDVSLDDVDDEYVQTYIETRAVYVSNATISFGVAWR